MSNAVSLICHASVEIFSSQKRGNIFDFEAFGHVAADPRFHHPAADVSPRFLQSLVNTRLQPQCGGLPRVSLTDLPA